MMTSPLWFEAALPRHRARRGPWLGGVRRASACYRLAGPAACLMKVLLSVLRVAVWAVPSTGRRVGNTVAVPIERSPADVLRFVVAAAGSLTLVVVEWLFGDTLIAFGSDLLRGLDAVPQWIVDVVALGTRILAAVMLGGGLLWTVYRQRWRMLVTVGVAGLLAAGLFVLVDDVVRPDDGGDPVAGGGRGGSCWSVSW